MFMFARRKTMINDAWSAVVFEQTETAETCVNLWSCGNPHNLDRKTSSLMPVIIPLPTTVGTVTSCHVVHRLDIRGSLIAVKWSVIGGGKRFLNIKMWQCKNFFDVDSKYFFVSLNLGQKAVRLCNRIQSEITKTMDKSISGWNLVDLWLFRETGRAVFSCRNMIWISFPSFHHDTDRMNIGP